MTRQEAMALLISKPNTKVRHYNFSNGDFVYINDERQFKDEENGFVIWDEFWTMRQGGQWENDWTVVE